MEELTDLRKKVNRLEYEEIKELKDDIANIKIDLNTNNILTKQSIDVTRKLSDTMDSVKEAMVNISNKLGETERTNQELKTSVQCLSSKFEKLETKVEENEDRGKFDYLLWFKQNFIALIMTGGVIGYIFLK